MRVMIAFEPLEIDCISVPPEWCPEILAEPWSISPVVSSNGVGTGGNTPWVFIVTGEATGECALCQRLQQENLRGPGHRLHRKDDQKQRERWQQQPRRRVHGCQIGRASCRERVYVLV